MAIDFSDGIVEGEDNVNPALIEYAKEQNKPILGYTGDDFADPYKNFINEVCPDEE